MLSSAPSAVGADPDENRGAVGTAAPAAATLVDGSMAVEVGADTENDADDAAADASEIGANGSVATMAVFDTPIKATCCSTIGTAFDDGSGDNVEEEEEVDNCEVESTMASADPLCNHR